MPYEMLRKARTQAARVAKGSCAVGTASPFGSLADVAGVTLSRRGSSLYVR